MDVCVCMSVCVCVCVMSCNEQFVDVQEDLLCVSGRVVEKIVL